MFLLLLLTLFNLLHVYNFPVPREVRIRNLVLESYGPLTGVGWSMLVHRILKYGGPGLIEATARGKHNAGLSFCL